jgi:putative (di)nucleoside polyphosphate hydrolase
MRARAVRAAAWGGESWPRAIEGLDPPIFMSTWPLAVLLLSLLVESRAFGPVHRTPTSLLRPARLLCALAPILRGGAGARGVKMAADPKYRPCASALVFNIRRQIFIGERSDRVGQWQLPQGGIDDGESPADAAVRELYEEMGLRTPDHVTLVETLEETIPYDVPPGTWLSKAGFAGQRLHFTLLFFPGDGAPPADLSGLGGEKPEFAQAKWSSFGDLVPTMVGFKRDVYARLQVPLPRPPSPPLRKSDAHLSTPRTNRTRISPRFVQIGRTSLSRTPPSFLPGPPRDATAPRPGSLALRAAPIGRRASQEIAEPRMAAYLAER